MGRADYYADGDYNIWCDRCGAKMKASEAKKTYDGYHVHEKCWYPRHPQELNKGMKDNQSVPFITSQPATVFTSGYVQLCNGSAFVSVTTILSTSTVTLTNNIPDGIIGTVSFVITAGSGFQITSTSSDDMSQYSWSVTI